ACRTAERSMARVCTHPIVLNPAQRQTRPFPVSHSSIGTDIAHAAGILRGGGLVAFPTETVYGLGADASSPSAVARIFAVKGRPRAHPLIVHLAAAEQLDAWCESPGDA